MSVDATLLPSEQLAMRLSERGVHSLPDHTGETLCVIPLAALAAAHMSKAELHRLLDECSVRPVHANTDDMQDCIRITM